MIFDLRQKQKIFKVRSMSEKINDMIFFSQFRLALIYKVEF